MTKPLTRIFSPARGSVVVCLGWLLAAAGTLQTATAAPPPPPPLVLSAPSQTNGARPTPLTQAELAVVRQFLVVDLNNLHNYAAPSLPVHYDADLLRTDNTPPDNRITNAGATLGRVLFYDRQLSTTRTVSCSSCHQQTNGFTDLQRFSAGVVPGKLGTAHAMRLGNVSFYRPGNMFWDRRAATLEAQATQPMQNPVEMGFDAANGGMSALIARMKTLPYYPLLFKWVYGTTDITEVRIQKALAQFERAMISASSRWDTGYASVYNPALPDKGLSLDVPGLTAQENLGRRLFIQGPATGGLGCGGCHEAPTFALRGNSLSNGLDAGTTTVFKAPSLKNVAQGRAFMHDGRFSTLEQVIDFYDHGVQAGPSLDPRLIGANGRPRVLNLSPANKAALVAFLKTLTDTNLANDPRFSNPFNL